MTTVLPIASALTGLLPLGVSLVFLFCLLLADGQWLTWHVVFLVPIVLLQMMLVIAIGFLVAATTVFFRDLTYALPNLLTVILFASPIFYPLESMPRIVRTLSQFNPFYVLSQAYRDALVNHQIPDLWGLLFVATISTVLGLGTLFVFRRVKSFFEAAL